MKPSGIKVSLIPCIIALIFVAAPGCGDEAAQPTVAAGAICGEGIDESGTQLLTNPDFSQQTAGWTKIEESQGGLNTVTAESESSCGDVVTFVREGAAGATGLIALEQPLDIRRDTYARVKLQMVLRIDFQELTSDGVAAGVTPAFVSFFYERDDGSMSSLTRGFVVDGSEIRFPDRDRNIQPSYWFTYNIEDVFSLVPDAARIRSEERRVGKEC